MTRLMRAGCPTAFTIDGPKGPRYVAKMGAVLLAKKTGQPILPFTISATALGSETKLGRFQVPCLLRAPALTSHRQSSFRQILTTRDLKRNAMNCKLCSMRSITDEQCGELRSERSMAGSPLAHVTILGQRILLSSILG